MNWRPSSSPADLSGDQRARVQTGGFLPMTNEASEQVSPAAPPAASAGRRNSDRPSRQADSRQGTTAEATVGPSRIQNARRVRASELKINAALAASAVEALLGRSKTARTTAETVQPKPPTNAATIQNSVDSKSFKVLVINDDPHPCEIIVQSLMDFTIEQINDGVSGLAGLISYEPDLVVLDLDIPVVDGFKSCPHSRDAQRAVIIVSSTLAQSSDSVRPPS